MAITVAHEGFVDLQPPQLSEQPADSLPGAWMLAAGLAASLVGLFVLTRGPELEPLSTGAGIGLWCAAVWLLSGLTPVAPGEARVVQLFGGYVGTIRGAGLRWVNPFSRRRKVSTRLRSHETAVAKVNDADGIPIEIAAVVVWRVVDSARAVYAADDVAAFVAVQAEAAVRHIATSFPYDGNHRAQPSLRANPDEITQRLSAEIAARVATAGVQVIESRITRLAYAPEVAQAMLRRQQAPAVVAARQQIVEGAVGMVQLALARLEEQEIVELDPERKAAMVSNLLVVLCSDHPSLPVVNVGSLYH
jgi:regulator of protease activity HflC (stomatin/prohibitin superfamily)